MRVLIVGASGELGRAITEAFAGHELVLASRSGEEKVDLTDLASISALYERVGTVDAVACAAGHVPFASVTDLTIEEYREGLTDKLLGQIALVRLGLDHVTDGGSFTLITGITADDPIATGSVASTVNGALHSFVLAAAIELPRGLRVNAVSPTMFTESEPAYGPFFPGFPPVPVAEAARAYVKSALGRQTGQVYRVGY
jgi:NAD(P)-dependent dehydrogenase (short-subunit alcohol dehydrogenase family)